MYADLADIAVVGQGGGQVARSEPNGVMPTKGISKVQKWRTYFRRTALVLLPVVIAVTVAIAAVKHGPVRVYWSLGSFLAILTTGVITLNKELNADAARNEAIRARIALATALTSAGQPLVAALGNVTSTDRLEDARANLLVLLNSAVGLAQTEIGRLSSCSKTRAAFYCFEGDNLVRRACRGYAASDVPRQEFTSGRSLHDDEVIRFAKGENARLVMDLENDPPPHFIDHRGRSYKSFVSVPVRAGNTSFGLLTADADSAFAIMEVDKGYLILIAGTLGAGLAHVAAIEANSIKPQPLQGGSVHASN